MRGGGRLGPLLPGGDGSHGRDELAEHVDDRLAALLDQAVGEQQQRVARFHRLSGLLVGGVRVHAEQHAAGQRELAGGPAAHQHRRQVPGAGPAQHAGIGVVEPAHDGADHAGGELAHDPVEHPEQLTRAGSGDGQSAQRVAGRHHPGHRVDAVPGHVTDHQQHVLTGQQQRVIPVTADQVPLADRPVPDRDVDAGRFHRLLVRRHDGLLQPQRQQVLLRDALLAAGELVPGRGQGNLRVVVRRDVLEGPAQRHHRAGRVGDRLGEHADLADAPVVGVDHPEDRGQGVTLLQQPLPEALHHGLVGRHHVAVQIGQRNLRARARCQAE